MKTILESGQAWRGYERALMVEMMKFVVSNMLIFQIINIQWLGLFY